jgi:hypothetical protein
VCSAGGVAYLQLEKSEALSRPQLHVVPLRRRPDCRAQQPCDRTREDGFGLRSTLVAARLLGRGLVEPRSHADLRKPTASVGFVHVPIGTKQGRRLTGPGEG